jgi:MFS family permease
MNCNTQKGLYFIIIGTIITIIYSIITSISYFFIKDVTTSMIISIFGIVSFIGAIIIFIGAILFFMGRKEFGKKHQKNVTNALIIIVINIIVVSILTIVIIILTFSKIITASSTNGISTLSAPFLPFIIIVSIISAALGSLIYYFALIELEDRNGKNILFAGIISSIAISIITSFYLAGMLGELFGSISTSSSSYTSFAYTQNVGKIGILAIIPNLLFLYSFYIPYKRIKDGDLVIIASSDSQASFSSRICPNCGRPIPFDANICPYCGKKLEN